MGDAKSTWTNGSVYWPDLITHDSIFSGVSVYVHEYDTELLKGGLNINELAQNMRLHFDNDTLGNHKEIIFLVHSMGGLITRDYLLSHREIAAKTRFIYFYSTPSTGSEIAKWAALVSKNPQFRFMKPLQSDDYLGEKDREWHEARLDQIPSYCAYEKQNTYGVLIVSQSSATHLCNQAVDAIDADHITIVKPVNDSATSYIAFRNAYRQTPSRTTDLHGNCSPANSAIKFSDDAVKIPSLVCAGDQSDLRLRFIWLNATAASVLLSGQIRGDLAKSIGDKPFLSKNAVTDELSKIVAKFGSYAQPPVGANANNQNVFVDVHAEDSDPNGEMIRGKRPVRTYLQTQNSIRVYEDHGSQLTLPDVETYIQIQSKDTLPANYSVCYSGESDNPLETVTLWRYVTKNDLDQYANNVAKMRDLLIHDQLKLDLGNFGKSLKHANLPLPTVPTELAAMQYFIRAGMPEDFALAAGSISSSPNCGGPTDFQIVAMPPKMFVLVAVIENVGSQKVMPLSMFKAEQIDTDRLRPREQDAGWKAINLPFPTGFLTMGESIVIPLEIEFRDTAWPRTGLDVNDEQLAFQKIQSDKRTEFFAKTATGAVIHKIRKSALPAPSIPYPVKYTYGPRIRLTSVISGSSEIKLRTFDPSQIYMRFGFDEGSCPRIYVTPAGGEPRVPYGKVLTGATDPKSAQWDILEYEGPASSIELVEEEPEITTIEELNVVVTDAMGIDHVLLRRTHLYVIPGAPLHIIAPEMLKAARIEVQIRGFYQPMGAMLLAGRGN